MYCFCEVLNVNLSPWSLVFQPLCLRHNHCCRESLFQFSNRFIPPPNLVRRHLAHLARLHRSADQVPGTQPEMGPGAGADSRIVVRRLLLHGLACRQTVQVELAQDGTEDFIGKLYPVRHVLF